jgi:alginate O-acetyltransferase complex protein AlgI
MLFNSYPFLLLFLPLVLAGFYLLGNKIGKSAGIAWLTFSSLFFYGYWHPGFLWLLIAHIVCNYALSRVMIRSGDKARGILCAAGIIVNLLVLGYFKYALFFLETVSPLFGGFGTLPSIVLPIGLSFHTFQQIAFICDVRKDPSKTDYRFLDYAFLVAFFPQLVAGPIVHHNELLPQVKNRITVWRLRRFAPGVALFLIGLCKKGVFADRVAPISNLLFDSAAAGGAPALADAWMGVTAYTLQLYFDFSGYSDMACGLALMFNFRLPVNFNSPYKSASIVDFWRRWHITLSRFLRNYVYIPMGGSRGTPGRTALTLMGTMLIGGLWHGAGWTFVLWGALHGFGLVINHTWRGLRKKSGLPALPAPFGWALTFLWVMGAWVFFRAPDFHSAGAILKGMVGLNGFSPGPMWSIIKDNQFAMAGILFVIILFAPNSQQWLRHFRPLLDHEPARFAKPGQFRLLPILSPAGALAMGIILIVILLNMPRVSEFIYFQF